LAASTQPTRAPRQARSRPAKVPEDQVDPRNRLNALTNRQWLLATKSVWSSIAPPRDELKARHPATFSEADVGRAIRFFTKPDGRVLDPFLGSGSTLVACAETGRSGVGIELIHEWADTAEERVRRALEKCQDDGRSEPDLRIRQGDARSVLGELDERSFDFVVTSPPYWSILRKDKGQKQRKERMDKGLPTRYSDEPGDLGNIPEYGDFIDNLGLVFAGCLRALRPGAYACVVVSDFRHGPVFYDYHADVTRVVKDEGFILEGITILYQESKNLYAYGRPYRYVPNVHHKYMLLFSRPREDAPRAR